MMSLPRRRAGGGGNQHHEALRVVRHAREASDGQAHRVVDVGVLDNEAWHRVPGGRAPLARNPVSESALSNEQKYHSLVDITNNQS